MKGLLKQISLFLVILKCINGIQVREDENESDDITTSAPAFLGTTASIENVTFATPSPTLSTTSQRPLSSSPASYRHLGIELNQTHGINSQITDMGSSVSLDASVNKKRQLYTGQGSYVIGASEISSKEIQPRSKEQHLNEGEEMKKDFKPSPELRITSPIYQPSAPAHPTVSGGGGGGYILPRPHSKPVSFSESNEDQFKWHTASVGPYPTHSTSPMYPTKSKLKTEYPKFETIVKNQPNQPTYQKQLFHRQHEQSDHSDPNDKGRVVWTATEPSVTAKPDREVDVVKGKHAENETEYRSTPQYHHPQMYEAPHSGFEGQEHDTPFSGINYGGAGPTLGYPGIDTEYDMILKTSDRPDMPMVPDYIIKSHEHAKGAPMHGIGGFKHHLHSKFHNDHLWKGVFKVLAAAVPLGILFSALSPNVVVVNANSTRPPQIPVFPRPPLPPLPPPQIPVLPQQPNFFAGRFRNDVDKSAAPNFISDLLRNMNVSQVDPGNAPIMSQICEERFYCELGRLGSHPQSNTDSTEFLQKLLWKIAIEVPDYQTKQPSVDVFNAMEKDDCSRFYCKNYDHFREVNKYDVREWRN